MNEIRFLEYGDGIAHAVVNQPLSDLEGNDILLNELIEGLDGRVEILEGGPGVLAFHPDMLPVWIDAATIRVLAGTYQVQGQAVTIEANVDITFADLDTGSEAEGFYYVWVEDDGSDFCLSLSPTAPTGMISPLLLKGGVANNASLNIIPQLLAGGYCFYDVTVACAGTDETEIFDGYLPASDWQDISCVKYVPVGKRLIQYACYTGSSGLKERVKGFTATNGYALFVGLAVRWVLGVDGVFQLKLGQTYTRAAVLAYQL